MITDTISTTEVFFTAASLIGFLTNGVMLNRSSRRLMQLYSSGRNGALRIEGWKQTTIHLLLTLPQFGFLTVGGIAMTLPPANPAQPVSPTVAAIAVVIILANLLLALAGMADLVGYRMLQVYFYRHGYRELVHPAEDASAATSRMPVSKADEGGQS